LFPRLGVFASDGRVPVLRPAPKRVPHAFHHLCTLFLAQHVWHIRNAKFGQRFSLTLLRCHVLFVFAHHVRSIKLERRGR
jgi:hypothetical protein